MAGSIDLGSSDHHLVYAVFSVIRSKPKPKIISVKNQKSLDVDKLKGDLDKAPWHIINTVEDIEDSGYLWENMFKDILGNRIKCRKAKVRDKSLPWMDTEIRKAMNQRYKYLKAAQANRGDIELWDRYKLERNSAKKMLRRAEANYWINLTEKSKSSRDFWKITYRILKTGRHEEIGPIRQ